MNTAKANCGHRTRWMTHFIGILCQVLEFALDFSSGSHLPVLKERLASLRQ